MKQQTKLLFLIGNKVVTLVKQNSKGTIKARDGQFIINAPAKMFLPFVGKITTKIDELPVEQGIDYLRAAWGK